MNRIEKLADIAYSFKSTLYHTYEMAVDVVSRDIPGFLIECGVGAGAQIGAMCIAMEKTNAVRGIVGFDSFEGIPMAGPNDDQQPGIGEHSNNGELISSGISVHSLPNVKNNLEKCGIKYPVNWVQGWFQYTVPLWRGDIALLRLDGDLYESTKVCLEYLLPQVVPGGVVIIDDYALPGCRMACDEYRIKGIDVPGSGGVIWFKK